MKTALILAGALCAGLVAQARAANPTPGLPLFTAQSPKVVSPQKATLPASPLEAPRAAPPAAVDVSAEQDPARAAALLALVQEAESGTPKRLPPPPPRDLNVESGTTVSVVMALGALNRIQTPFADPVVTHSKTLAVQRMGSVLYLSSNDPAPTALFITPRNDPNQAIALTMHPTVGLDPVAVRLHLAGFEESQTAATPHDAAKFEASQPYVDTLKDIFRDLALGQIPQGYGFSEIKGSTPWMPRCRMAGISITPRQLLDGGNLVTIVARAVNTSIDTTEITESGCAGPGVLAVAAWPSIRLEPGQETELYIAVRRPDPAAEGSRRPSALQRGG